MKNLMKKCGKYAVLMLMMLSMMCMALPVQAQSTLEKKTTSVVTKQTKNITDKKAKMKTLYLYLQKMKYGRAAVMKATNAQAKKYALDMLNKKSGNCYSYASAYAFLVKKATGYTTRVRIGQSKAMYGRWTDHAWCEVKIGGKWYICDANMDQYDSAKKKNQKYFLKLASGKAMKNVYKPAKSINVKF